PVAKAPVAKIEKSAPQVVETAKPAVVETIKPAVVEAAQPVVVAQPQVEIRPALHVVTPAEPTLRVWTDNTGKHQVNARLVSVGATSVRLLKDSGKYTTVPFYRLSVEDQEFVGRQTATTIAEK